MNHSKPRAEKAEGSSSTDVPRRSVIRLLLSQGRKRPSCLRDTWILSDALTAAWARLTARLAELSDEIEEKQQRTIPEATYHELVENPSFELVQRIRQCGSVVIRKTVSEEQALKWLDDVREYIKLNPPVKGFPEDDKQVYEIYWPKAQQQARSHSQMLKTQAALLSIFTAAPDCKVSLTSPLVYSDRLRIRNPGDAKFALGPHMDGGSIERWEDPTYRQVYEKISNQLI
ncbi:hypothetical protein QL093DRAFT_2578113 [Fusarium oxysporum]|nr:hypothetical protein QL093DRAFT_2578113 [Fusarium oxysporum]